MAQIKIKPSCANRVVLHGSKNKKLGDKTPAELLNLAIIARDSGNRMLLDMFEELPSIEELKAAQTDEQLAALTLPAAPVKQTKTKVSADTKADAPEQA